jgi:hypothetical protein
MLSYVGGFTQGYSGTASNIVVPLTTLTGGTDSAPSADDIVVVCFSIGTTATRALVIAGYTIIATGYANDTFDTELRAGYKLMGVTPDTTVTLTGGTISTAAAGVVEVHVWRGVDLVTPIDVTTVTTTGTNSAIPTPPPITPITPGAIILAGAGNAHNRGSGTFTASYLSNFLTVVQSDTNDATGGLGSVAWASGTYTPATWTWSAANSTSYSRVAFTTALRPAVPGVLAVGSEGQGAVGTVSIVVSDLVQVVGVSGTAAVGTVRIAGWTTISDAQTPNWNNVTDTQTPNWINIATT